MNGTNESIFEELEAYVKKHGTVNLKELQNRFGLSESQLRTYLSILGFAFKGPNDTTNKCDRNCQSCPLKPFCG